MEKNAPEKRIASGNVVATIWKNHASAEGKEFDFRTISLQRRYTDKEGKWQNSNTLRLNDLPKATLVLEEAYKYLVLNKSS